MSFYENLFISSLIVFANSVFPSEDHYQYLDQLAINAGTDKSSLYHNYTKVYSQYFHSLKDEHIKFLEIGIDRGSSVKLWENYFKNAELHFIDITMQYVQYWSQQSQYHLANQEDPQSLQSVMNQTKGDFDIILDDGGHTMKGQITSFKVLFPYVKSGGMYIIEDLQTSYWGEYGKSPTQQSTIDFLKTLVDSVNYVVGHFPSYTNHYHINPDALKKLNIYQKDILSMHFYENLVIILKR